MKENICTVIGVFGGFIAALLGGWDSAMITLVIFMGIDFTTGLITATMGRSKHSKTGKLSSKAGWVGLAKKFCILLMVVVAVRMDILIGTTYIRDATCIGFCVNELLSIIENTSLMGIPYPPAIKKAIEVLQKRAAHIDDEIEEMIDNMEEADVFLSIIKGKQFEFPVYYDVEEKKQFDLGKEKVSAIMRAFLERVEAAGYFVGLYGSASSLTTHTADDIKSRYTIWLAHWVNQTSYGGAYGIWQHSEKGRVDGINGNVDLDIGYKDFPTIIKGRGLNGYGAEPTPAPAPDAPDAGVAVTVQIGKDSYKGMLKKV